MVPEPEPAVEMITGPQMKKMQALFGQLGITDRADKLAYCSQRVGREVTSAKDLTKAEAIRVIDALEAPAEPTLDADEESTSDWPETPEVEP